MKIYKYEKVKKCVCMCLYVCVCLFVSVSAYVYIPVTAKLEIIACIAHSAELKDKLQNSFLLLSFS